MRYILIPNLNFYAKDPDLLVFTTKDLKKALNKQQQGILKAQRIPDQKATKKSRGNSNFHLTFFVV